MLTFKEQKHRFQLHPIMILAIVLSLLGLMNLYSATLNFESEGASQYFISQAIYILVSVPIALVLSRLSLKTLFSFALPFYILTLLLLIFVLGFGAASNGALSWIDLGVVRLQPSEFGKLGLVLILARYFSEIQLDRSMTLREMIKPILFFLLPTILVILQNDLGSSLFYGFVFGTMLMVQGVLFRYILIAIILVTLTAGISYQYVLKPYQKDRILSFANPELDPRGSGYHITQSKVAVGSGGLWGKGYTRGQSHRLKFLPERHTDFVFPVLLEEWGFLGGSFILFLYFIFLVTGLNVASMRDNRFGFFVSVGIVAVFFWHLIINVGGVLGLLPLTGVPLPFFSYGGSALLSNWISIGILLALARED